MNKRSLTHPYVTLRPLVQFRHTTVLASVRSCNSRMWSLISQRPNRGQEPRSNLNREENEVYQGPGIMKNWLIRKQPRELNRV